MVHSLEINLILNDFISVSVKKNAISSDYHHPSRRLNSAVPQRHQRVSTHTQKPIYT